MNKYVLGILVKNTRNLFDLKGSSVKVVNIETDLELIPTEDFISEYPENLIRVLDVINLELKYDENIVSCKVEVYNEPNFQKIVLGAVKKFRKPQEYNAYKISATEVLIVAYDSFYHFNVSKNAIKKLKLPYINPENDFQKIDFDMNSIPDNVIFLQ